VAACGNSGQQQPCYFAATVIPRIDIKGRREDYPRQCSTAAIRRTQFPLATRPSRRQRDAALPPSYEESVPHSIADNGPTTTCRIPTPACIGGDPPSLTSPPAYAQFQNRSLDFVSSPDSEREPSPGPNMRRLHPRVAVLLGVNNHWHKWLFFCRLLSIAPALKFGIPLLWTLLHVFIEGPPPLGSTYVRSDLERRLWTTEVFLAAFWVRMRIGTWEELRG
jgi:hypothetical protein